jgi:hypothetical protein
MQSNAKTVAEYLNELESLRAAEVVALRDLVLKNLPKGYQETMSWGMISYEIPMDISGGTYNNQPLVYAAIASQKNHLSLYLMSVYSKPEIEAEFLKLWHKSNKKLDMGKSCLRFRKMEEVSLEAISYAISALELPEYLKIAQEPRVTRKRSSSTKEI